MTTVDFITTLFCEVGIFCISPRICSAPHIRGYAELRNMRSQQSSPPGIHSKSADVLHIFLVSVGITKTLEEANTELIEAKNTALLLASAPKSALLDS
jgi:hypothetical protein